MIEYRIDRRSGVAPYMQIVQQTRQALRMGRLGVGDKLPTAREVVASTAINPNTVLKAYRELEHEGLVDSRAGVGAFVRRSLGRLESSLESPLADALGVWVRQARDGDLERPDIEALVKAVIDLEFEGSPPTDGMLTEGTPS
ncbi:MAG: GntR family transcriptional regulator [Nakamurella sp.]